MNMMRPDRIPHTISPTGMMYRMDMND
jgi:hypothetical protein